MNVRLRILRLVIGIGTVGLLPMLSACGDESDAAVDSPADKQCLIVVVGAPGTDEYGSQLVEWADRLKTAAAHGEVIFERLGTGTETTADAANGGADPAAASSDLEQLRQLLSRYGSVDTTEPLWLIMLGHGSFDTRHARFNMRGPDLSATELSELAGQVSRPLAVVCSFSCSSPFLNALSGDNRVVVTSTKDGNQVQWNRFGDAFSRAFVSEDSDVDRDGQTSLLEAWLYASRRTADFYTTEGRLATEHALLDDNGDAAGSRSELFVGIRPADNIEEPASVDGRVAGRWHLVRSEEERRLTIAQREQRNALEAELESLKSRKASMDEAAYLDAIEDVLLQLGAIYRAADATQAAGEQNVSIPQ